MNTSSQLMLLALAEAVKAQGSCAPNPAVGAVVVRNGSIIATGFHRGPGLPHAEVEALNGLQGDLSECELYVTLEPCCHYGRTPPCTERIKQSGIKSVFFGLFDPNPEVAGRGQQQLQEADIKCDYIALDEVETFYRAYRFWWQHKMPWVTTKLAIDAQHNLAIETITGPECQLYTHQMRSTHDAILTTVNTILHDNPKLNARLIDTAIKKPLFILDKNAALPLSANVLSTCDPITIFYHGAASSVIQSLEVLGVRCIQIPLSDNQLDLIFCLRKIAELGVHALWVESGWQSTAALITKGLVQEMLFYIALKPHTAKVKPFKFVYEPVNARDIEFESLGSDLLVRLS